MSVPSRRMIHVPMGPAPLEPLDRPHPRPVRSPSPRPVRSPSPGPASPVRRSSAASRARHTRRRTAFLLFAGLLVGLLMFLLVSAQAMVAQSSFRGNDLRARVKELQLQQGELRFHVAELQSPGRLAQEAAKLRMVLPAEVNLIHVPADDPRGRIAPGTPGR